MDIQNYFLKLHPYYVWFYSRTGITERELLIVGSAAIAVLLLILHHLRKSRIRRIHIIQRSTRSNIIGVKLSDREQRPPQVRQKIKRHSQQNLEEQDQQSWSQSTKEWRQLREKIRHLQHDISKHERTEKHLNEQIAELKAINEQLKAEIEGKIQVENTFQVENNEQKQAALTQNQSEESSMNDGYNVKVVELGQTNQEPENISLDNQVSDSHSQSTENTDNSAEISSQTSSDSDTDNSEQDNNVPLDIKELKAIANLVRKLQTRSQQRRSE